MEKTMAVEGTIPPKVTGATPRIDGPLKVSGSAQYTSDFILPGMLYAVPVTSTVASGKIATLDTAAAAKMPGVKAVFHRENIGPLYRVAPAMGMEAILDERRPPFEDDKVRYYGQYVALAVAQTFEQATAAAKAVKVTYTTSPADVSDQLKPEGDLKVDSQRGNAEEAFRTAPVKVDQTYGTPTETHNPIELHASVASWDGQNYTLYETSQAVVNSRQVLSQMLGVPEENVRVISRFLGSGFGGKLWPWPHAALAAAASRNLSRPVKLVVSRSTMFESVGHRPRTQQRVRLGATPDGKLVSFIHESLNHTSILDDYSEGCGEATSYLYSTPNLKSASGLVRRNVGTPTSMRGPGAVPGLYATESAMNELAIALKMDPVELRLKNEPKIDEGINKPFSSRHSAECMTVGMEKFGWKNRTPAVGSMKRDGLVLGWGMAQCSWIAVRTDASATVELRRDGTARVMCATQDIGTGTYTVLAQIVAGKTGVPLDKIDVTLGDTKLPEGPISGGSWATASVIPAVLDAATKAMQTVLMAAGQVKGSPFDGKKPEEMEFTDGRVRLKGDASSSGMPFQEILQRTNVAAASGTGKSEGTFSNPKPDYSTHSFGAQFAEVTWQPEIARLRVSRVVTVIDAGHIINPKPAKNQIEGAVVMGVGMALFEQTRYDKRYGGPINNNLADYIVTTNADAPEIDVTFLDYPDKILNELGARGVGEIGLAGIAAAITDAVYHATGVRVRDLPVKIEDLLTA